MEWQNLAGLGGGVLTLLGVIATAWYGFRGKKREVTVSADHNRTTAIADRWDDASELATKMREYIEAEVEKQVAPIRSELARVKNESHEMHDAVRARETQLWLWDQRGRPGDLPALPAPILIRLGLGHLTPATPSKETP